MGSRDISGPILRVCFGAVRKETTLSKLLDWVLEEMATAQKDMDITGDMDSHHYYEGMVDAYEQVALWIAPFKMEMGEEYCKLLGKVWKPPTSSESETAA